ncbi:DNA polymerase III subunit delta [Oceanisphaera profunda]|uniref:DNA polymerase III subunit delta n=1 Tax=Oceanisphaera profunda TaxID=1416627 RepID=A0A1Y0D6W0_9GAMM|nr:DNA polymerase III subunit delta [Oceanisphaera profunda]ART83283.1 DNA polymerase III subunit delta [Oceanisphaera profunda]
MRLYPEKLAQHLKAGLAPCYFIYGDEPLLKQEALDLLRHTARGQGFDERLRFDADQGLDWDEIFAASQSLSLFSQRQIIELQLPEKLDKTASERLRELLKQCHPDLLLLITGPKLNQQQQKGAWFTALSNAGPVIPVATPEGPHFARWLSQRLQQNGLQVEAEGVRWLAFAFEGNLLALSGEIEKLVLQNLPQPLTLALLQEQVQPHHQFNPFQLFDPLLEGKVKRGCRILLQLRSEGIDAGMLCHLLARELNALLQMQLGLSAGQSFSQLASELRIWSSRQNLVQSALNRLPLAKLQQLQSMLAAADVAVASFDDDEAWRWLYSICVGFLDGKKMLVAP